ncbi:MAG: ApaG domain, partial [Caulobacterales bacterium]
MRTHSRRKGPPATKDNVMLYEAQTLGIIVRVQPEFMDARSDPEKSEFMWSYTVEIENSGEMTVRLMTRSWRILDSLGRQQ